MKRIVLFFSIVLVYAGSSYKGDTPEKIHEYLKLVKAESSGRWWARSKKGAIGKHQITWIALKDYNNRNGTKYKMKDMYNCIKSGFVYWDYIERSFNYFIAYSETSAYKPLVYSSYNIGRDGSIKMHKGKKVLRIYDRYIRKILLSEEMAAFDKEYIVIYWETPRIKYYVPLKDTLRRKVKRIL